MPARLSGAAREFAPGGNAVMASSVVSVADPAPKHTRPPLIIGRSVPGASRSGNRRRAPAAPRDLRARRTEPEDPASSMLSRRRLSLSSRRHGGPLSRAPKSPRRVGPFSGRAYAFAKSRPRTAICAVSSTNSAIWSASLMSRPRATSPCPLSRKAASSGHESKSARIWGKNDGGTA